MLAKALLLLVAAAPLRASSLPTAPDASSADLLASCVGYRAANVAILEGGGLTADLHLEGQGCGVYGDDIDQLHLEVTYESGA